MCSPFFFITNNPIINSSVHRAPISHWKLNSSKKSQAASLSLSFSIMPIHRDTKHTNTHSAITHNNMSRVQTSTPIFHLLLRSPPWRTLPRHLSLLLHPHRCSSRNSAAWSRSRLLRTKPSPLRSGTGSPWNLFSTHDNNNNNREQKITNKEEASQVPVPIEPKEEKEEDKEHGEEENEDEIRDVEEPMWVTKVYKKKKLLAKREKKSWRRWRISEIRIDNLCKFVFCYFYNLYAVFLHLLFSGVEL